MSTEQIERELLKLPASERARLAERFIASLDEEAERSRTPSETSGAGSGGSLDRPGIIRGTG